MSIHGTPDWSCHLECPREQVDLIWRRVLSSDLSQQFLSGIVPVKGTDLFVLHEGTDLMRQHAICLPIYRLCSLSGQPGTVARRGQN